MSAFVTGNGLPVSCTDQKCSCNVTPAAIKATAEEKWFDSLVEHVEEYLHLYAAHRDAPKSERDDAAAKLHDAKTELVATFYTKGW